MYQKISQYSGHFSQAAIHTTADQLSEACKPELAS